MRRRHPVGGPGGIIRCLSSNTGGQAKSRAACRNQDARPQETYDLLVVDEFTYALTFGWLSVEDGWCSRGPGVVPTRDHHVAATIRRARRLRDLDTEMGRVKRPFDAGIGRSSGSIGDARLPDVFTGTQYQHRNAPKPGRR